MSYVIGSFNMLKMNYRSDKEISKDYARIAQIIKNERFDIVALQEVFNEGAIKHLLLPALGPGEWDYVWASPEPFSSSSNEGYAYIWRKRRFRLLNNNDNPQIYSRIKSGVGSGAVIRPPFVARFTPSGLIGGSNFELRLINTHIIFSKPSGVTAFISDSDLRRQELRILSEEVYRLVSSKRYGSFMPAYTILMGDYNLCLAGEGPHFDRIIPIDKKRNLLSVQTEKTSLRTPTDEDDPGDENEFYSKNYDHFSYESSLPQKMLLVDSRVEALGKYYQNDLEAYRREVSDHVPIKLVIDLKLNGGVGHYGIRERAT